MGEAVGLRPQPHPPRPREGAVSRAEELLAVERDPEAVALDPEPQLLPHPGRYLDVDTRELLPFAVYHLVETDVVLERVGPGDVVVVRLLEPDHQARRLVDLSRDGLEAHPDLNVSRLGALQDREREA